MSASITDVTVTSQITSTFLSATTSLSTVSDPNATYTISSESTATMSVITSTIYVTPSTTYVAAPTPTAPSTTYIVTSTVISTPNGGGANTLPPTLVTITSTVPYDPATVSTNPATDTSTSTSATPSALRPTEGRSSGGGGLATGAKIAIAVIIPIVVIAAAFILGLFFWRKRRARKGREEMRKSEMADYGFNPNENPSLVPVAAGFVDNNSENREETSGYRGWGNTSNRKTSTAPGSNSKPGGAQLSDSGSQPGGYGFYPSPSTTAHGSEHYSADPLYSGHPEVGDNVGALGGGTAAGAAVGGLARHRSSHNGGIRRGPSNASSAYSDGGRAYSEASSDSPGIGSGTFYHEDTPYNVYSDQHQNLGPYGDGTYGGAAPVQQPVIRDVQARRNTRIERAPTFPQQAPGGISQNF